MIKAVIDLGTNTFHLLIAETDRKSYIKPIWQERSYVFLASDGIGQISQAARDRALTTVRNFQIKIEELRPTEILVSGTEAFRKAKNGSQISGLVSDILKTEVHILSGEEEAMMIAKGVKLALFPLFQNGIAIDIGGGSTELVSFENGEVAALISQPCGIAYLYNRFHLEDPISRSSLDQMKEYIVSCFSQFIKAHSSKMGNGGFMIGVAGTFEVLQDLSQKALNTSLTPQLTKIDHSFLDPLIEKVAQLDFEGRQAIRGLPKERAMYFLEGLMIMQQIWELHPFDAFCISGYSIKHGLMISDF